MAEQFKKMQLQHKYQEANNTSEKRYRAGKEEQVVAVKEEIGALIYTSKIPQNGNLTK